MTPFMSHNFAGHATVSRIRKRVYGWAWLAVLFTAPALGSPLELTGEGDKPQRIAFDYLIDESASATLEQIQQQPAEAFRRSGPNGVTLAFIKSAVWLRFDVINRGPPDMTWLLQVMDPLLDDIRIYQQGTAGNWTEYQLGDHSTEARQVEAINPVVPITLARDQPTRFYIRVQSKSSMLINVRLLTSSQYYNYTTASYLGYGAMFGVVAAMCLYNLFLFFSLRDWNYLLYVVSIGTTALFLASLSGHAPRWLWPEYRAWSEEIFQIIVAVVLVAGLLFADRFLEAKKYAPRLHQVILVLIGLSILTAPLSYLTGFQVSVHLTGAVSATSGMVGLLTAAVCLMNGQRSARYYLIAWAGYCIGTVFTAARQHGLAGNDFIAVHGMEMGAVMETVLISFALSDRYNQLRQAKEDAQREVAESLRRMDRLKDEFLANTSHELRTPLQGIIGLAESMLDGAAGKVNEAAAKNLGMIVSSGQRLANLVSDILDFSKMKNHELTLRKQPVDLHVAVDVVMRLSAPLAQVKSLELINEIDHSVPPVLADEDRLQQILHNLIGNAIKFTDAGSVRVKAVEEDDKVRIQIIDTGPGIDPMDHERIFESFEQVEESATRSHGGTGLGLAVTRNLVALHGSKVDVDSSLGNGSTFSFTLPRAEADQSLDAPPVLTEDQASGLQALQSSGQDSAVGDALAFTEALASSAELLPERKSNGDRMRILVVDDEPVNQQVMQNHLVVEDYEVVQAENGMRALELLREGEQFDLILLDVMMPMLSGFEVCREIRKTHLPTQLPIVMVTARTQTQDLQFGLQVGANDYITKPVAKEELLARIKTHLNLLRINSAYSHYVPHEFMRYLRKDSIMDVRLGDNVEMEAAVLVSDIRSFTTLSETMTPDQNFAFINSYFSVAGPPIRRNGGFVDHYVGDGIMAVFPGGAEDALKAARETMEGLKDFNVARDREGREPIRIGVGLHCGQLRLGIVGEEERRQGDIFADTVNVASRIESVTKTYGSSLIVSEAFLSGLSDPDAQLPQRRGLGGVKVKGRAGAVILHEAFEFDPPDLAAHKQKTRDAFEQAQQHFHAARYSETVALLEPIIEAHAGDAAARYLQQQAEAGLRGLLAG